ncbi:ATP-binding protein [Halobacterium salinarum]|uniref:ATP-binding protein n=1 Tax=Halobacterium salinarum TaxID=2242 RepID=UPI0025578295|nr:ATP-binding protein [Halobacterium salinarum]MDL0136859.1 ATP-binding protein [Halobacterium salinarum]MDL0139449.1 ATP-binding protein [Halobacterium salinarum]
MSAADASPTGRTLIGTVAGPGDGPNEFFVVTPDEQAVKTGEFLTYTVTVEGVERDVIARVTNREQERGLPDTFMADPNVAPETVAATLGVPTDDIDLYRLEATVIGFYDTRMQTFSNPRQLPRPGTRLYTAPDAMLEAVLPNLGVDGDDATDANGAVDLSQVDVTERDGLAHMGWLLNRETNAVDIHIPIDEFAATHLAILASTGSGKSYTAGVLMEEMMMADSRASLLVFDPHGEYDTLGEMRGNDRFAGDDGYQPEVTYFDPENLRIRISELSVGDVMSILDNLSDRMQERLDGGWRAMQRRDSRTWGIDDLMDEMRRQYDEDDSSVGALEWRLRRSIQRNDLFTTDANVALDELVAPGRCTVLQMDTLSRRDQQMIATVLLRRLYEARLAAVRDRGDDPNYDGEIIEHPLFSLFEEGHRFAPATGEAPSLGIMRTITSEGRKFGFGLGIISQRPSKIDQDVLSQCGTQVTMQIQNPTDQDAIKNSVEAAGEDVLRELPGLTPGQAVVSGDAMNTPVLIHVRERYTAPGGESIPATSRWRQAQQRRQDQPTRSESADMGGGESSGEEDLL